MSLIIHIKNIRRDNFLRISEPFEKTEKWTRVIVHRAKRKIQDLIKEN